MIDVIDELILSALSKNCKQDVVELWDYLRDHGFNLTEDEIESRITKLEEEKVISHYTISLGAKLRGELLGSLLLDSRFHNTFPNALKV